jgi:AcrR family transcriptional regulator
MDTIAAAAGIGKGTLFRAFGSRDGLLDALWAAKLSALREAVEKGEPPLGPGAPSAERAVAFLDALLTFKLENRHLIRAREIAPRLLQSEHYKWMHGLLENLIEDAARGVTADETVYAAHALLAALHIDLIEELLANGVSLQAIRCSQATHARAVIDDARRSRRQ